MLNFLILINVLWSYNRISLFLGTTLKYLWSKGMSVKYWKMFQKKSACGGDVQRESGDKANDKEHRTKC